MSLPLIALALLVLVVLWLIAAYNGLITLKNRTTEAWSDIDVQLKRRHDLIPNLIETVRGYAKHEKDVFTDVTKARTEAMKVSGDPAKLAAAENVLTSALKSVFAVAESYPELKASANFLHLQEELTDTEDKLEAARRFYNANVRDFNTKQEVFPTSIFARTLGFTQREFFEAAAGEKGNVSVAFDK